MYLDRFNLTGRNAVITGGGRGIGLSCADALAEAGAHVVIADVDSNIAKEGLRFLHDKGHSAESVIMDVTDARQVTDTAAQLVGSLRQVDILVCNAGIARTGTQAEDVTDEHWLNVLNVNL